MTSSTDAWLAPPRIPPGGVVVDSTMLRIAFAPSPCQPGADETLA
jgi:hypothetical protein